jgi:ribosomal-protein-alanine N-acetyltransferase
MTSNEAVFLQGERVALKPLGQSDISPEYLSWLNDADVLRYRAPKAFPTTIAQLEQWVASIPSRGELVLSIRARESGQHVGNISLGTILWTHRSAELAIMIGAKDVWGKGYGTEAITLLSKHAFESMGLHRLGATSPNPAFNASVRKLGWTAEGVRREAFFVDGKFVDFESWGLLEQEWRSGKGRMPVRSLPE